MSRIEMEELDTNEDGIIEKYPIYVQSKAQRIPDLVIHNWLILSLVVLETDPGL